MKIIKTKEQLKKSLETRFFSRIKKTSSCWLWVGHKTKRGGYGTIYCGSEKKLIRAHRYSYEYFKGPITKNLFVCHKCDTPSCVNPSHLFLGDNTDNMRDASKKGRLKGPKYGVRKTVCKRGHKIEGDNLLVIPRGKQCKTCKTQMDLLYRKNNKLKKSIYNKKYRIKMKLKNKETAVRFVRAKRQ